MEKNKELIDCDYHMFKHIITSIRLNNKNNCGKWSDFSCSNDVIKYFDFFDLNIPHQIKKIIDNILENYESEEECEYEANFVLNCFMKMITENKKI